MEHLQILLILMFLSTLVIGLAQRIHIPYPIALVISGTLIGFIPGLSPPPFDPQMILLVVLPPILYTAAYNISTREFTRNWKPIFSLALGLVLATTLAIACLFKWLFPQFSWALAFAFGAIVSPPDAIATTAILKRFSIGPRLLSILEGESLVNDASALVLYRFAVFALLTGTFSLTEGIVEFFRISLGGILLGWVLGHAFQKFAKKFLSPTVGVVFSFTVPYVIFIIASFLEVSGVLAVVVSGLITSAIVISHQSPQRRLLGYASWDIFTIQLNCFAFVLIGLQLRSLTSQMTTEEILLYTGYAFLITFALCAIRLLWVYSKSIINYVKALKLPDAEKICPQILHNAAVVGWSGMRGIVSLTAALALPYAAADGSPLQGRSETIFITFMVILISLLVPGFTLPVLIKWLGIHHTTKHHVAHQARKKLVEVAESHLNKHLEENKMSQSEHNFLLNYFNLQRRVVEIATSPHGKLKNLETIRKVIINEQRKYLVHIWKRKEIDDLLLTQLEHELDLEETYAVRAELI